jgi:CBS domain-containing protein
VAGNVGRFIGFLFILTGVWRVLGGNLINGMWIVFIGWFLESAAAAQIQLQTLHALLAGHTVAESMSWDYPEIAGDTVLKELLEDTRLRQGGGSAVVKAGDEVVGLLTPHDFGGVPLAKWSTTTVAQVMVPVTRMQWVGPDTDLEAAVETMDRAGVSQLPVMASGRVVGMLSRADLLGFFRRLQPLNGSGWSPAR